MQWREIPHAVIVAFAERRHRLVSVGAPGECWPNNCRGYGSFRGYPMHRVVYASSHGQVPHGMVVAHKCDNKRCCNPRHLEAITHTQNVRDAHARNRVKYERGSERYNAVITEHEAAEIAALHTSKGWGRRRIAKALGIKESVVKKVLEGRTWAHVTGFGDRYKRPAVPYTTKSERRRRGLLPSHTEAA